VAQHSANTPSETQVCVRSANLSQCSDDSLGWEQQTPGPLLRIVLSSRLFRSGTVFASFQAHLLEELLVLLEELLVLASVCELFPPVPIALEPERPPRRAPRTRNISPAERGAARPLIQSRVRHARRDQHIHCLGVRCEQYGGAGIRSRPRRHHIIDEQNSFP
jgi:hypothetical protein